MLRISISSIGHFNDNFNYNLKLIVRIFLTKFTFLLFQRIFNHNLNALQLGALKNIRLTRSIQQFHVFVLVQKITFDVCPILPIIIGFDNIV